MNNYIVDKVLTKVRFEVLISIIIGMIIPSTLNALKIMPLTADESYEWRPILTIGKSWDIWHGSYVSVNKDFVDSEPHEIYHVTVEDNDFVDGKLCYIINIEMQKKSHVESCWQCIQNFKEDSLSSQKYYLYEENNMIYVYRNPGPFFVYDEMNHPIDVEYGLPYFDLYMNYNLKEGDYSKAMGLITEEYHKDYGGELCRVLSNGPDDIYSWMDGVGSSLWIEGIGSNVLLNEWNYFLPPLQPLPTCMSRSFLILCRENGKILYDARLELIEMGIDIGTLEDISENPSVIIPEENFQRYHNLQGLPIDKPKKGEIYILNGKKVML